jgi:hypothetical protein
MKDIAAVRLMADSGGMMADIAAALRQFRV